ncbi:hypothetical protein Y032_0166g61 [Ancylostoma ceylanicum]|uniref:Uncharacterized protein n=1 Tax=Ancylostoma ceylanicum TaxID=53326 RepID=A0A016SWR4_9BILA|nr:hypothetical protein Y032_0166g61 [Ancylostoma ceylanicum]
MVQTFYLGQLPLRTGPGFIIEITHGKCADARVNRATLCGVNKFTLGNLSDVCQIHIFSVPGCIVGITQGNRIDASGQICVVLTRLPWVIVQKKLYIAAEVPGCIIKITQGKRVGARVEGDRIDASAERANLCGVDTFTLGNLNDAYSC